METTSPSGSTEPPDPLDGEPAGPTVVSFYSSTGGVGRTMAAANVAWILASAGRHVLLIDWDLPYPGLHRFLRPFLTDPELARTPGIVDLVLAHRAATGAGPDVDLARHTVTLHWAFDNPSGRIDFLGAGRQDSAYADAVAAFDWPEFRDSAAGGRFIGQLRSAIRSGPYDYVLIDTAGGHPDTPGVCAPLPPDVLVIGFTLNNQAIEGAAAMTAAIQRTAPHGLRILPVPMRVEQGEPEKRELSLALCHQRFARLLPGAEGAEQSRYWGAVEIPYRPQYAYEEVLATFHDRPDSGNTLLAAYERLTSEITERRVTRLVPMDEGRRRMYLRRFERQTADAPRTAYVVSSPRDRLWADWIREQLRQAGMTLMERAPGSGHDPELPDVDSIVVVLSPTLALAPDAERVMELFLRGAAGSPSGPPGLVAVRVEEGQDRSLDSAFTAIPGVNLKDHDEETARQLLIEQLGRIAALPPLIDEDPSDTGPRFPGRTPAVRDMAPLNPVFVGREPLITELRNRLPPGAGAKPSLLSGLPGIGKSQIALEYAHRFASDYDVVWWIDARQAISVRRSLALLALRLEAVASASMPNAAEAALRALCADDRKHRRWLLVYDNADTPGDVVTLLPEPGAGHVLITSRSAAWKDTIAPLRVGEFAPAESVEMLHRRMPHLDPREAHRLLDTIGHLPQTVEQAAASLDVYGEAPGDAVDTYVTRFRHARQQAPAADFAEYAATTAAAWRLTLDDLRAEQPAGSRLLELIAFLSADGVALDLLHSPRALELLCAADERLVDTVLFPRVLHDLARRALVRVDYQGRGRILSHSLFLAFLRDHMDEQSQQSTRHQILRLLADYAPPDASADDTYYNDGYAELNKHINPSGALDSTDDAVRRWLVNQVRFLWRTHQWFSAVELGDRVLARWQSARPAREADPLLPRLCVQLANAHRALGEFGRAEQLNTPALEELRRILGIEHPHSLTAARSRGVDLLYAGRFLDAFTEDQATWDGYRHLFGDEHPDTLSAASNLAVSLSLTGVPQEAIQLDRETYERRKRVLGADHHRTWVSARNLGTYYRELGQYETSRVQLREAYEQFTRMGEAARIDRSHTARSLAATLRRCGGSGLVREAQRLDEMALERYRELGGARHPNALACVLSLAADYRALGRHERARQLADEVLPLYEQVFGAQHPFTHICRVNLALLTRESGYSSPHPDWGEEGRRGLADTVGAEHPYTLLASLGQANALMAAGRAEEALRLDESTAAGLRTRLGPTHPYTKAAEENLRDSRHRAERRADGAVPDGRPAHPVQDRGRTDIDIDMPIF
ncbi:FxSxx-COOH system tetratricopeptide repeat protein [Streptomyces sp. SDT5-1]|uniref:FxSxx-COOH system tetratricopeptide repeat protein n=1 Tax=Streptomyces sp. SDT5-1 TaxID=3406418 RepID=UPI003FD61586